VANTKHKETYKQASKLTKNNIPIIAKALKHVLGESARCCGFDDARNVNKGITIKKK
jgi:hypothetical protein